ncbi:MAG: hypothetical protein ACI9F2_000711 [Lysobacterales bacterium]|jgi:hypothetical protein
MFQNKITCKCLSLFICLAMIALQIRPVDAQMLPSLPMATATSGILEAGLLYNPILIKGLTIHPDNPLRFDFILGMGDDQLDIQSQYFHDEASKLIKYFLNNRDRH